MAARSACFALFVVAAVATASCGPANHRVTLSQQAMAEVRQAGDGGRIDMTDVANFDWDQMYAFCCYARDIDVSETIGFSWGNGDNLRLASDSMVLVVFVKDKEVAGWDILNNYDSRGPRIDFDDSLYYTAIPRQEAVFTAKLSAEKTIAGYDMYVLDQAP